MERTFTFGKSLNELLTYSLVSLFLGDLINLIKKLSHPQLEFCQLVFGSNLCVVIRVFTNQNFQVNSLYKNTKIKYLVVTYKHNQIQTTERYASTSLSSGFHKTKWISVII